MEDNMVKLSIKLIVYLYSQILDEIEIHELLINHVDHRCCWGSRPAHTWKIHFVEDCNVYVGTLETFVEEREVITETESYRGGNIDGKDKGPWTWYLGTRSMVRIPSSIYSSQRIPCSNPPFWIHQMLRL